MDCLIEGREPVKYLKAFGFSFTVTDLDYFDPPIIELTIKNDAGKESIFSNPIAITTLNFYTFDRERQDEEEMSQVNEEQGMNQIVSSKSASEVLGRTK